MLIFHTRNTRWLSNTWLVADREGGHAVLIDTGGPIEPILERIREWRVTPTHVLCTHHHHDHVLHNADYKQHFGCPVCGHRDESELFGDLDHEMVDGEEVRSGDLNIRALHVPGHTLGQLAFLIDEKEVFTGDTLFQGSVGGTRGRGHTTYEDLQHSIMEVLMRLPKDTVVRPGHMEASTIEREWQGNPFVRFWRGAGDAAERRCKALNETGFLLLEAEDYDGGTKCLVRFDDGRVDVVPGSRVVVEPS